VEVVIKKISKNKPIFIAPLGDIQYTSDKRAVARDHLKRDIDRALEAGAMFLGLGDYIDLASPSNRRRIQGAGFYDSVMEALEEQATGLCDRLYDEFLEPTKNRWIGLLEGHHFMTYRGKEEEDVLMTSDMYLAKRLNTQFLGTSCMIRLEAGKGDDDQLTIFAHHGVGSGILAGSVINRLGRVSAWVDSDIVLMGHWTRRGAVPEQRLRLLNNGELGDHTTQLVATGGYGRAYQERHREGIIPRGNYVERFLMRPVTLGGVLISWTPGEKPPKVLV
jgi:hypothetical protein